MISYLRGRIIKSAENFVILDVNNVGYQVFLAPEQARSMIVGSETEVFTHHYIREDAMDLYGFLLPAELEFFEKLISISGIGPKTAMNILSVTEVEKLKQAIIKKDLLFLNKISGIGKKTAERMILELEGKLIGTAEGHEHATSSADVDVLEALQSLGYSQEQARRALKDTDQSLRSTDEKLKAALKNLAK